MTSSSRSRPMSRLLQAHQSGDGGGQPLPLCRFFVEMPAARTRERVDLRTPVVAAPRPLGGDPSLLLQLVERGVERAVADLQHIARDLAETLADRESVERLERQDLQNQQVERA